MSVEKQHISGYYFIFIGCIIIFACSFIANAQIPQNNDLQVVFLKDTVIQDGSTLSFNRANITNNSSVKVAFGLEINLPPGWSSLLDVRKVFTIEPGQTLELPIRVAAPNATLSDRLYAITLLVVKSGIGGKLPYTYIARVKANSKWRVSLLNPDLKLDRINKETYFQFKVSNSGNVTQELNLNFNTSLDLTLPKRNNKFNVRSNSDTVIRVGIITEPRYLEEFRAQDIGIELINKDKEQLVLVQKVYSNNTLFRENPSRWYTAPMFLELVSQNFNIKSQQLYFINSNGTIPLEKGRSIAFNFRSNEFFTDAAQNTSTRYSNVNYLTKNWIISVGDQTEFSNFLVDGFGGKIEYKTNKGYRFKGLGVKSRFGDANLFTFDQEAPIGKEGVLINKMLGNLDRLNDVKSFSDILEYNKRFGDFGSLGLIAGYGIEKINRPNFVNSGQGQTAGLRYDYTSPKFIARTTNSITTRDFPGLERGVKRSSNELRYVMKNYFAGGLAEYNDRSVSTIDSNQLIYLFGGQTSEYGIRGGYYKERNNLTVTASIVDQLQDSLTNTKFRSNKLNINSGLGISKSIGLTLSGNLVKSFALNAPGGKSFYAMNAFGSIQSDRIGLSFRLDKGPLYYSELLAISQNGAETNRYQISPYLERSFFKEALTTRFEFNYVHDIPSNLRSYVARADLNVDLKKNGFSLRFYGSHDFGNQNALNSLNMSIKKNFTTPLIGFKKYTSLKVTLFKDNNDNGIYDLNDEAIPESNIKIGNQNFTTNKMGQAFYKNIKQGEYIIDLGDVSNIRGWIAKSGFKPVVSVTKSQDLYIPFQRSRFLSGNLNLVKDPFSKKEFNAANIRVSAISSKGEVFSTLTNEDGAFFLNLSKDTYLIQINASVFNEDFRVLQESFNIDLNEKEEEKVVFEIRERKRLINIR